jgi:FdhD protein
MVMHQAQETPIVCVRGGAARRIQDNVAIERALEIRVRISGRDQVLTTTMRTPGEDQWLAAGFLRAEGIVRDASELLLLESAGDDAVVAELAASAAAAVAASERRFVTSAACGVCGRSSLDGMEKVTRLPQAYDHPRLSHAVIHALPGALRVAQATFERTGGLHAAGLFSTSGALLAVHEDVGRHNAVDKLVGRMLLEGRLPAAEQLLMVSGRASFELVQKAEAAGIPILAAVGAPSTLAIERATAAGMTLMGFVRDGGFNVYSGAARVAGLDDALDAA